MKRYKLLKDLPFAKAGEEFSLHRGGIKDCITLFKDDEEIYQFKVGENVSEMFDEWFEEIKEEQSFIINTLKAQAEKTMKVYHSKRAIENLKSLGLLFKTKEEAEEYLEYLKAKEVIKQDAKGFKPDWTDADQVKYSGYWHLLTSQIGHVWELTHKGSEIYFKSEEDIEESFKKHSKEWKTYLTYKQ